MNDRERGLSVIRAYVAEERRAGTKFNDLNAEAVEGLLANGLGREQKSAIEPPLVSPPRSQTRMAKKKIERTLVSVPKGSQYRVFLSGNSGDGFTYSIEILSVDTYLDQAVHVPGPITLRSYSVDGLRAEVKALAAALDAPVLAVVTDIVESRIGNMK